MSLTALGKCLWNVFRWIAKVAYVVVKWSITHPYVAVAVGLGLWLGAQWLRQQPWAGAELTADLVEGAAVYGFLIPGGIVSVAIKLGLKTWALILMLYKIIRDYGAGLSPYGMRIGSVAKEISRRTPSQRETGVPDVWRARW